MKKFSLAICKNETRTDHQGWIDACDKFRHELDYTIIDLTRSDWMERILEKPYDCFLMRPPGMVEFFKQMYDERVYVMHHMLNLPIYPTYEEIIIYENKKMLSYWLQVNDVKHARTRVYYDKKEAIEFIDSVSYPFLAKTAIGASGSGVKIVKSRQEAINYLNRAFSSTGISRSWMPNVRKGKILERIKNRLDNFPELIKYLKQRHREATIDPQKHFVIFQDYLEVIEEWRCVRIGDSFFAHKKQRRGDRFSGGGGIDWDPPTMEILDFMKEVTDKRGFLSQAIDIFVTNDNQHYLNELQCFFGFIHPQHQMIINGVGGRYLQINGKWVFEAGTFNENNSYNLRIEHVLSLLKEDNLRSVIQK